MSPRHTPRHRAERCRRLPRAVTGAATAVVAVVLLVGAQGSLAGWQATRSVAGASVRAGALGLSPSPGCSTWTFTRTGGPASWVGTTYPAATTDASGTQYLEPGDALTMTCTYALRAVGAHLRGAFEVTQPAGAPAGVSATATYAVGGASRSTFTDADDGATVVATVTLDVPSTLTTVQNSSFTLSGVTVTARQVHA